MSLEEEVLHGAMCSNREGFAGYRCGGGFILQWWTNGSGERSSILFYPTLIFIFGCMDKDKTKKMIKREGISPVL